MEPGHWFAFDRDRGRLSLDSQRHEGTAHMSEPSSHTEAAGEGISDEEMVETVASQTDSASENADTAGKDWNGDPSDAPAPTDQA
jgi:NACalpha-BTF3-like transcription factor